MLVGCDSTLTTVEYNLEINDVIGLGTVNPAAGTYTFEKGTSVDLIVTSYPGGEFSEWSGSDGDDVATVDEESGEYRILMDSNKEITALFIPAPLLVPTDYPTIQAAIDASAHGDIIMVEPGIYNENIDFKGKNITLRSIIPTDPDIVAATIIDGDGSGRVVTFDSEESEEAVLWGFTIRGGDATGLFGSNDGGGILINNSSSPLISGNLITGNTAQRGAGVFVGNQSSPVFKDNTFENNTATNRQATGIYVIQKSSVTISNNIFQNNNGGAIHIGHTGISNDQSSATITNNLIDNNIPDHGTGGITVIYDSDAIIEGNTITNNFGRGDHRGAAITIYHSSAEITDNIISNNEGWQRGAVVISTNSVATINNNTITGNTAGEPGENGSGGGISVISVSNAHIFENTISENTAWNSNCGGGGIFISASEATIDDNDILNNHAYRYGGGIYLWGGVTKATITNNNISDNSAMDHWQAQGGGIHVGNITEATIYGNDISNNWAEWYGGGIYIYQNIPIYGAGETSWNRENSPPGNETNNTYSENAHGDNQYGGADAFFRETI